MSIRLMSQVWDNYHGPAGRKLVLLCLADFSDDGGMAWPSIATVARKSDMAPSTVKVHLSALRKEGCLIPQGFSGSDYSASRRYRVVPPRPESGQGRNPAPGRNTPHPPAGIRPQSTSEPPGTTRGKRGACS